MTRLEYCKKVLELVGGKWPYAGALADASTSFRLKTPEQVAELIKGRAERKARRAARELNAE